MSLGRRRFLGGALAVTGAGAVAGCGSDSSTGATRAGDGVVEQYDVADRRPVPEISGTLLDGREFISSALAGQVVVYNVWGSWCAPCRTEAPVLRRVHRETQAWGAAFVGINVRDNDEAARAFERRFRIGYPSIDTATAPDALRAFGAALPPSAVPSTLVVDRSGRLAARVIGPVGYGTLSALVGDALGGRAGTTR
nr:TlpA disulfide reductase family protein [Nocardioides perillae]